jgi:hypothetical protein
MASFAPIHVARQQTASAQPNPATGEWSDFVAALRADVAVEHPCDLTSQASIDAAKTGMPAYIPAHLSKERMQSRLAIGPRRT